MQYTRTMIDLVKEARKRVHADDKPSIKLANPELLDELLALYVDSKDAVFKAVVKELFALAGDPWPAALEKATVVNLVQPASDTTPSSGKKFTTRVYRGQTILVEKAPSDSDKPFDPNRSMRIYRGKVVG